MSIYKFDRDQNEITPIPSTTFAELDMKEDELQACLKSQIGAISPHTLVIAEKFKFSAWIDSNREIDLLGIDEEANFVVIELKRTEDGRHMELQSLRYAAMISNFTFDKAAEIYQEFLKKEKGEDIEPDYARGELLSYLKWEGEPREDEFGQGVKIVLASAGFSPELTTTVMWLIDNSQIDISCVKIVPHKLDEQILLDVQPVIPTPDAKDYQVSVKEKRQKERESRKSRKTYDLTIDGNPVVQELPVNRLMWRLVKEIYDRDVGLDTVERALNNQSATKYEKYEGKFNSEEVKTRIMKKDRAGKRPRTRRFFCQEEQLFHIGDYTFVLSNGWTGDQARDALRDFQKELPKWKIESSLLTGES
ncbi:MAG: hypothetical protein OXF31_13835 [Gammaproteobacteria bacterium]|nr:hypothetical protein [Gammaproteobacteria bacterium]